MDAADVEGDLERIRGAPGHSKKLMNLAIFPVLVLLAHTAYAGPFEDGLSFFEGGHYRWALEKFIEATDRAPRDPQGWWYVAESYRMLGDAPASAHVYRQILQLAPASTFAVAARRTLEALGEPGTSSVQVPIQRRGGSALVAARVNGEPVGVFILDTGASYTSVSTTVANRLGIATSGNSTVRLATASGVIQAPLAVLDEVDVGGAVARHVPVVVHDLPGMPSNVAGLLGMSFLERFRVNLDINSSLLILESGN
jgi:clan AA aspartic protease (TIGR02281 family)